MSQFHGPQPGFKGRDSLNKGVMRRRKEQKRLEAEIRDENLAPDDPRRRKIRLGITPEPPKKRHRSRNKAQGPLSVQVLESV